MEEVKNTAEPVKNKVESQVEEINKTTNNVKKLKVPRFKYKTIKSLHDPKDSYPTIKESTFKFYNFEECTRGEGKEPYIIYLKKEKVEDAYSKENKAYMKSIITATKNVGVVLILGAVVCGGLYMVFKVVS